MNAAEARLTILGVDNRVISVNETTFDATRGVVRHYYTNKHEVTRILLRGGSNANPSNRELALRRIPLVLFVDMYESVIVMVKSVYHQLTYGDAYQLATMVGPLIGHFSIIRTALIPSMISANIGSQEKLGDIKELQRGMRKIADKVDYLSDAAAIWRYDSPRPSYRAMYEYAEDAASDLIEVILAKSKSVHSTPSQTRHSGHRNQNNSNRADQQLEQTEDQP